MASASPNLLSDPIIPTLVRLASPNVVGLFAQTLTIAYDGYIVARLGTDALPLFAGAAATWVHNGLAAIHTGAGNMRVPAACLVGSALAHIALCPALVFGLGPFPEMGIAGASLSFVTLNALFACVQAWPLVTGRAAVLLRAAPLRMPAMREVLKVGLPASVSPFISNGTVIVLTGYAGTFGTATLAGYGVGARLEYLLIPLVFGFGAALLAMVGRNIGAGQAERASRIAWTGSSLVAAITGCIGIVLAFFPELWTRWFIADAAGPARAAADLYLHIAGGFYGPFGFGLAFFFASQGAGRLKWPLIGSAARLAVASAGGALAVAAQSLVALYAVIGVSFLVYAVIPGAAFRMGGWAVADRALPRT